MAMYQDSNGNWRSGDAPSGSKSNYNYTNVNGQQVNNTPAPTRKSSSSQNLTPPSFYNPTPAPTGGSQFMIGGGSTPAPSSNRGPWGMAEPASYPVSAYSQPPTPAPTPAPTAFAPVYAPAVPYAPPAPTPAFQTKTQEQIATEAKAKTDALLARRTTISNQTKEGFQTAFDRLKATTKDDRTLSDASFQLNANPFSGRTAYDKSVIGRQREISDQQASQDLATRLANVDMDLADYANATEAERLKMEDEMVQRERQYGVQLDQLAVQRRGQELNQFNADRTFNYGVGRDAINDAIAADTTKYNRGQDQIKNDQTKSNYNLLLRQQHINEASDLSKRFGITVDPKDDYQLMLDQVAGLPTVEQRSAEEKQIAARKEEAWKRTEMYGSVQPGDDAVLGIPVGTQTQKAKEAAMEYVYKNNASGASQQRNIDSAAQKASASRQKEMMSEKQGLVNAIRSGQTTTEKAKMTIRQDMQFGFYTPEEARELLAILDILSRPVGMPSSDQLLSNTMNPLNGLINR